MSARVLAAVWVPGVPRTQGSMKSVGRGNMAHSPALVAWRSLVRDEIARDMRLRFNGDDRVIASPYAGPVAVRCVFVRGDGIGDIDKLARAVLDALTESGVIGDDVQVVKLNCDRIERTTPVRGDGAFVLVATVDTSYGAAIGQTLGNEIDGWVGR